MNAETPKATASANPSMLSDVQIHSLAAKGRHQEALDAARVALAGSPLNLNLLGVAAYCTEVFGLLEESAVYLRQLAALQPNNAERHNSLAYALYRLKRFDEAEAGFRRALSIEPNFAKAHTNLGILQYELGRTDEAITSFRSALACSPNSHEACNNLGNILFDIRQYPEAETLSRKAIRIKPDYADAYCNLGRVFIELKRYDEATASLRRAVSYNPEFVEAHSFLGNAFKERQQYDDAINCYREALRIKPNFARARNCWAEVLEAQGKFIEANECYLSGTSFEPSTAIDFYNYGILYRKLKLFEESLASYHKALAMRPGYVEAHSELGLLYLYSGQYKEGWQHYEFRYHPGITNWKITIPNLPFPKWGGESIVGKSLLVMYEQGHGDTIQFCRFVSNLKSMGAKTVNLVVYESLKPLIETLEMVDNIFVGGKLPDLEGHDYWTFIMSLPLYCGITLDTIPATLPYLAATDERIRNWAGAIPQQGLRVGLVWKGSALHKNDANRSLPSLQALASLWRVPGVVFISLQKGQGEDEAAHPPEGQPIIDLGSAIQDFADSAAIVSQLDLVICIDTAIAHLAGALNKPCWVLIPAIETDWRWLIDRDDSPWYPGVMRLFRQTTPGDWSAEVEAIAEALGQFSQQNSLQAQV